MHDLNVHDIVLYHDKEYTVKIIESKLINGKKEVYLHLVDKKGKEIILNQNDLIISIEEKNSDKPKEQDKSSLVIRKQSFRITTSDAPKDAIIEKIANEEKITEDKTKHYLDKIFSTISETLINGEEVSIPGFGKFVPTIRPEKMGINPATGEKQIYPESKVVRFKSSTVLRDMIDPNRTASIEIIELVKKPEKPKPAPKPVAAKVPTEKPVAKAKVEPKQTKTKKPKSIKEKETENKPKPVSKKTTKSTVAKSTTTNKPKSKVEKKVPETLVVEKQKTQKPVAAKKPKPVSKKEAVKKEITKKETTASKPQSKNIKEPLIVEKTVKVKIVKADPKDLKFKKGFLISSLILVSLILVAAFLLLKVLGMNETNGSVVWPDVITKTFYGFTLPDWNSVGEILNWTANIVLIIVLPVWWIIWITIFSIKYSKHVKNKKQIENVQEADLEGIETISVVIQKDDKK